MSLGLDRDERRRLAQMEFLGTLDEEELYQVGRELYWRAEQFTSRVRMVVNDEMRRRGMAEVPVSGGGELDYGGTS
jgi:hypothetical protein